METPASPHVLVVMVVGGLKTIITSHFVEAEKEKTAAANPTPTDLLDCFAWFAIGNTHKPPSLVSARRTAVHVHVDSILVQ